MSEVIRVYPFEVMAAKLIVKRAKEGKGPAASPAVVALANARPATRRQA